MIFGKKRKMLRSLYPLSLDTIENHRELLIPIFEEVCPHKGAYIGVTLLDATFLCSEDTFDVLSVGERLIVVEDELLKNSMGSVLDVKRENGAMLGSLSFQASILPSLLLRRDIKLWCYLEAKSMAGGVPKIAVSVYCEKY